MLINDDMLNEDRLEFMNPLIKKTDSKAQFERWYTTKLKDSLITKTIKNQHDFHLHIIKQLYKNNVTIIAGTDAGIGITMPGFSMHKELAFYKEAGMSNYEVLKTATVNAAKTHKIMHNLGSIEPGKTANLLVLNTNPLSDLKTLQNPVTVFIQGKKLNRQTLHRFEENAKGRKNIVATGLRYFENLVIEKYIR